jgi:thioredoxin reductase (NADPH)
LALDLQDLPVHSQSSINKSRAILLVVGRRGAPRRWDVAGEDAKKVIYQLIDTEQYKGKHVLVVGGGDSALEAATSFADQPGTTVTLSYRCKAFGLPNQRVEKKWRQKRRPKPLKLY